VYTVAPGIGLPAVSSTTPLIVPPIACDVGTATKPTVVTAKTAVNRIDLNRPTEAPIAAE
jgi:hypothetical protein